VEVGETFEEGAIREAKEETGIHLRLHELRVVSVFNRGGAEHAIFQANVPRFRPYFEDNEHDAAVWVFPEETPYPAVPGLMNIIMLSGGCL
jgi:8-oxo-dGTP pyrophosphatase MutT (NUDIX family)